jgi:transposase
MSIFIGVDVAKYEHVASAFDSSTGELVVDSLHFDNNVEGFNTLLSALSKFDDCVFGFESTAHYHQNLFSFLSSKKFKCYLLNPIQTCRFRGLSIRNAKNDNIDSRSIAQFLMFSSEELIQEDFTQNDLKELCTQRDDLLKESSKLKTQLLSYLDRVFPELESIVGKTGIHSKAIYAVLKECPTAKRISSTRIDHLIHLSNVASGKKFKEEKIRLIKEASKNSVGFDSAALALKIKQTIESLEHIKRQIDEVNNAIQENPSVCESPLHKIKGMNSIEIAYIMSAIVNIARFDSIKKVVAYAGLDPIVRQSGTFNASRTRMSKRGNKLLRYALIWAANNVRKHNSDMKDYYLKKRSEGKNHYNALGHCAVKLIRYIYWVLNHPDEDFSN